MFSTELKRFILCANRFLNVVIVFYPVEKTFFSIESLVEKPVGKQHKAHEFSFRVNKYSKTMERTYKNK